MMIPRITLLLLLATGAAACSHDSSAAPQRDETAPVAVQTVAAHRVSVPEVLKLDGTLEPYREAKLSPLVAGHVSDVKVERGDRVKKGDPLIVLRTDALRLAASSARARATAQREQLAFDDQGRLDLEKVPDVAAAQTDRDLAADDLARMTPLYESGAIDARTFERSKAALQAAEARLAGAKRRATAGYATYHSLQADAALRQDDAKNGTLVAPFDGAVMDRMVEIGEFVAPQQPVVELVDTTRLRLELEVPERSSAGVKVGQPVEVEVDGTGQKLTGEIAFVAAAIEPKRRTLSVEAVIDNAAGDVRAGHFARARLALDQKRELLRVPRSALAERAGVERIYVVEGNRASARIVEVVDLEGDDILVKVDLPDGTTLVSPLPNGIADGVTIALPSAAH
ncbi:MAG: efflux RND transporter periplasmic adaptor subunit [Polyangiaceae bacterium]